jgi:hypothetical protein
LADCGLSDDRFDIVAGGLVLLHPRDHVLLHLLVRLALLRVQVDVEGLWRKYRRHRLDVAE